jgi:hypothetical protein
MNNNLAKSLSRAVALLETPADYEKYTLIKIRPTNGGCCCFHCWPKTWFSFNDYIAPNKPIKDEGDVLIRKNNEKLVVECHESGPEIIFYGAVSGILSGLIVELIKLFIENLYKEGKGVRSVTLMRYRKIQEKTEDIVEIELPVFDKNACYLSNSINNFIKIDNSLETISIKTEKYYFKKGTKLKSTLDRTYLSKPTVVYKGKSVWPEIAVLLEFKSKGYKGVWVDAFHRKFWENDKEKVSLTDLPDKAQESLGKGASGCWDLILWKGKDIKFVELKGVPSRDKIRESQIRFKERLLEEYFKPKDFTIIEWDYKK